MQQYSVCLAVLIIDCEVFVHFHRLQDYASDLESIASKLPDAFKVRVHLTTILAKAFIKKWCTHILYCYNWLQQHSLPITVLRHCT